MSAPLPYRPRLAEHAMARRHLVDGEEVVVIHDARTGDLVRMEPRIWSILAACDGTREIDGIALAATRAGAYRRASELRSAIEELHAKGLLFDGIEPPALPQPVPDRPLDVLPDFSLVCDESGACCTLYGSILFSPLEAARARTLAPDVLGDGAGGSPHREDRVFLPAFGANERGMLAVTLVDNRCAYLDKSGRCSLHMAGGDEAKPRGCRIYPASFTDDGETIRVSVGVECPCVLASAARGSSRRILLGAGAPLVPATARTGADLQPGMRIATLPERIAITAGADAPRAELVAWSRAVASMGPPRDAVHALWSLAAAVDSDGLDEGAARRAFEGPRGRIAEEILPWIEALHGRARARLESAASWRSERDRSRVASAWILEAAEALTSDSAIEAALDAPIDLGLGASRVRAPVRDPDADAFYVRALLHGHHLVDEIPLASALRDRAVRILAGRSLGAVLARAAPDDPARPYPLTLIESMMRAHGLKAYAQGK